jgi:hypothetical protein
MPDEIELRGVENVDGISSLVVGSAEYGSQASEPLRKTRRAEGIDHIVMMRKGERSSLASYVQVSR